MKSRYGLVAALLLVAGCASQATEENTLRVRVADACTIYSEGMNTLADLRLEGQLSDEVWERIKVADNDVAPYCIDQSQVTTVNKYRIITKAITQLIISQVTLETQ